MTNVLLIHGFPFNASLWSDIVPALSGRATVVTPDLPGFGREAPGPDTMEGYAQWVLARMPGRCVVVGHSMGGYIAFALHRLAPDRVQALGLVCTRAGADSPEARAKRFETAQQVVTNGVGVLEQSMLPKLLAPQAPPAMTERVRALIRAATPEGAAPALRAMATRPDSTPALRSIAVPTAVIAGRHDALIPAADAEAMARAIPGARLTWAERSGHVAMIEEPVVVAEAIAALL